MKYLIKGYAFFQNKDSNFESLKRMFKNQYRYYSVKYFQKVMNNGEKCDRKWLMFSESTGCVFCNVCKLFSTDYDNVFVKSGFYNWKKAKQTIFGHENSKECIQCMIKWVEFIKQNTHVDEYTVSQKIIRPKEFFPIKNVYALNYTKNNE